MKYYEKKFTFFFFYLVSCNPPSPHRFTFSKKRSCIDCVGLYEAASKLSATLPAIIIGLAYTIIGYSIIESANIHDTIDINDIILQSNQILNPVIAGPEILAMLDQGLNLGHIYATLISLMVESGNFPIHNTNIDINTFAAQIHP